MCLLITLVSARNITATNIPVIRCDPWIRMRMENGDEIPSQSKGRHHLDVISCSCRNIQYDDDGDDDDDDGDDVMV